MLTTCAYCGVGCTFEAQLQGEQVVDRGLQAGVRLVQPLLVAVPGVRYDLLHPLLGRLEYHPQVRGGLAEIGGKQGVETYLHERQ